MRNWQRKKFYNIDSRQVDLPAYPAPVVVALVGEEPGLNDKTFYAS